MVETARNATIVCCFTLSLIAQSVMLREVAKANTERVAAVKELRSIRRYTLHNPRWPEDAVQEVLVTMDSNNNTKYAILSSTAKGLQKEVLKRILDGEAEVLKKHDADFTTANYDAQPSGTRVINGNRCEVLDLTPKLTAKYLLRGWACAESQDKALVHVEGETAKSVSFWVGTVYIRQDFRKVGTFRYSSLSKSTADVKLLGKTELTIEYLDYKIMPKVGPVIVACRTGGCASALHQPPREQRTQVRLPAATTHATYR